MSEVFANLLEEELQQCADITKFVDCVFTTLSNHPRSRSAFIRQVRRTKDTGMPLSPVPETKSVSGQSGTTYSRTVSPHDENASAQSNDNLLAIVTSSETHVHTNAVSLQHSSTLSPVIPESSRTPGRLTNEDGSLEAPQSDHSSLSVKGTRRQNTLRIQARKKTETTLSDSGLCRHGQKRKRNIFRGEISSTGSQSLASSATQRRFRGPGKKKRSCPPDFAVPRFSKIDESLRRQIFEHDVLNGLQDLWKMVHAFRPNTTEQLHGRPPDSLIQQLQRRIEFCDILEQKGESLLVRAVVERRFYMVLLIAEYQKAKEGKEAGAGSEDVDEAFKRDLFPGKESKHVKSTWDYYLRRGRPLLAAVERYCYGVLLFPLRRVTNKSLHHLNGEQISDFLDYLGKCHPCLERFLCGLSYFLPKLIISGLPSADLPILNVQFHALTTYDDESFNRLLSPSSDVNITNLEPLSYNRETLFRLPWPDIEVAITSQRDAIGECCSPGSIPGSTLNKEFGSGSVTQPSLGVRPGYFSKTSKQFHRKIRAQLPPIQEIFGQITGNSPDISNGLL